MARATGNPEIRRSRRWPLVGALLLLAAGCSEAQAPGRDLVLISLDTLREDRAGVHRLGADAVRETMPGLVEWARGAVSFERAYSSAPMTAPSHMTMFSGLVPMVHGVHNVNTSSAKMSALNEAWPTLTEVLSDAGYTTAAVVQAGNVLADMGFERGFDDFLSYEAGDGWSPRLNSVLRNAESDRPLFLFLHSYLPHAPYVPDRAHFGRFSDGRYRGPFRQRYERLVDLDAQSVQLQSRDFLVSEGEPTAADLRFLSDLYDENLYRADRFFTEAVARIEGRRGDRPILWCVTSDHGEAFGEHGELGHPSRLYTELLRVPLFLRADGFELDPLAAGFSAPFGLEGLAHELTRQLGVAPAPSWSRPDGLGALGTIGTSRDWIASLSTIDRRYLRSGGRGEREEWVVELDSDGREVRLREREAADDAGFAQLDVRWRAALGQSGQRTPLRFDLTLGGAGRQALEGLGYIQGDE